MPAALGTILSTTNVLVTGDGGAGFLETYTEEAAARTVTLVETNFVTMSALAFPETPDGVKRFKVSWNFAYTSSATTTNFEIKLYMGVNGTMADTLMRRWDELNVAIGLGQLNGSGSYVITPAVGDLFGLSHRRLGGSNFTVHGGGGTGPGYRSAVHVERIS